MLAARADFNLGCTRESTSPLWVAALNGHQDVVRQLVEARASVDTYSVALSGGCSPVWAALSRQHLDIASLLMTEWASVHNLPPRLWKNDTPVTLGKGKSQISISTEVQHEMRQLMYRARREEVVRWLRALSKAPNDVAPHSFDLLLRAPDIPVGISTNRAVPESAKHSVAFGSQTGATGPGLSYVTSTNILTPPQATGSFSLLGARLHVQAIPRPATTWNQWILEHDRDALLAPRWGRADNTKHKASSSGRHSIPLPPQLGQSAVVAARSAH